MTKSRAEEMAQNYFETQANSDNFCIAKAFLAGMKAMLDEAEKMAFNQYNKEGGMIYIYQLKKLLGEQNG